ncbi:MAG: hypothetical protein QOD99_2497 [Chthoniobacter sp.]|jgi:hypothetical protein|nr:hypothetical protein [Chthoniobacter sp.]
MLDLPFQAKMTDRLAAMLRGIAGREQRADPDVLPSIVWEHFTTGPRTGTWNWMLQSFSRKFMRSEDVLNVSDISFHLPCDDRHRLTGCVLDWREPDGLIAYEDGT